MEKTLGYIFGNLQVSEAAIKVIVSELKTQNKINKRFALLAMLGGIYILKNEIRHVKLMKEVNSLNKKIKEL